MVIIIKFCVIKSDKFKGHINGKRKWSTRWNDEGAKDKELRASESASHVGAADPRVNLVLAVGAHTD